MVIFHHDALIIGGGVAGMTAALRLAKAGRKVAVICKRKLSVCCSWYAQGGLAAVPIIGGKPIEGDSFQDHVTDTLRAGAGLCNEAVVQHYVKNAFKTVIEPLIEDGVAFTKSHDPTGSRGFPYSLHQEGGHSAPRIFHVSDYTGRAIMERLFGLALAHPNISIFEEHMAIDLISSAKLEKMH
eukprot:RCo033621